MWQAVRTHRCRVEQQVVVGHERQWCDILPDAHPVAGADAGAHLHWHCEVDVNMAIAPVGTTAADMLFLHWTVQVAAEGTSVFGSRTLTWLAADGTPLTTHQRSVCSEPVEDDAFVEAAQSARSHLWVRTRQDDRGDQRERGDRDEKAEATDVVPPPNQDAPGVSWTEQHSWRGLPSEVAQSATWVNVRYTLHGRTDVPTSLAPRVRLVIGQPQGCVSPTRAWCHWVPGHVATAGGGQVVQSCSLAPTTATRAIHHVVLLPPPPPPPPSHGGKQQRHHALAPVAELGHAYGRWYELAAKHGWQCASGDAPHTWGPPGTLYVRVAPSLSHDEPPAARGSADVTALTAEAWEATLHHVRSLAAAVPNARRAHQPAVLLLVFRQNDPRASPHVRLDSSTPLCTASDSSASPSDILERAHAVLVLDWQSTAETATPGGGTQRAGSGVAVYARSVLAPQAAPQPAACVWTCGYLSDVWRVLRAAPGAPLAAAALALRPSVHVLLAVPRSQWATELAPILLLQQVSGASRQRDHHQDHDGAGEGAEVGQDQAAAVAAFRSHSCLPIDWRVTVLYWNDQPHTDERQQEQQAATTDAICHWYSRACGADRLTFVCLRQPTAAHLRSAARAVTAATTAALVAAVPVRQLRAWRDFSTVLDALAGGASTATPAAKLFRRATMLARGVQASDFDLSLA